MTTVLIVARARPAMNSDQMNLRSRWDVREQLWFLHNSPSPQPSPASGRGSKAPGDNTAPRLNSFPRWGKAGIGAAHRLASNAVAPTPTLPQRGREPTHAARSSGVDPAQAERSDGPYGLSLPSGRAEKHRAWGGHGLRSKPMLRALTRCGCLSAAAQPRSEFRSAAPCPSIAGCPQRSGGTRPVGRTSFAYFSCASKKSRSPAGANSRPTAPLHRATLKFIAASAHSPSASSQFPLKPRH